MKKIIVILLVATLTLSFTACNSKQTNLESSKKSIESSEQIPNPFVDCDTLKDASTLAGFDISVPDVIESYSERSIRAIADNMIEVIYKNGDKEICIRKAIGNEDISGDYNKYTENNIATVDNLDVFIKGTDKKINVATWTDKDYTYAITSNEGLEKIKITDLVKSVITDEIIGGNASTCGQDESCDVEIANPFIPCKNLEKAKKLAGFDITVPNSIGGYSKNTIQAIKGNMIEISYKDGENEIIIRKACGNEDISGDYNEYDEKNTIKLDNYEVLVRGAEGKTNVATWVNDNYTYSISISNGMNRNSVVKLIQDIQ